MARFDVQSVRPTAGLTTASTHGLGVAPSVGVLITGTTAPLNTTQAAQAGLGCGFASSAAAHQTWSGYNAAFSNSSQLVEAGVSTLLMRTHTTAGGVNDGFQVTTLGSTQMTLGSIISTGDDIAYAVMGGDDVQSFFTDDAAAVSTVASTQASTGMGFQPNAAIVVGQSFASSVANFSFGFACIDTAGTRHQWSISQAAREASGGNGKKSASTASALKLHTSATTAHDVSVTSFRSSGVELTVNATDTARPATVSVLGLSVPRVAAGKASITTNGVGAGQTGVNVTGLGQNVGLVFLASIGSSLQTLQAGNAFSVGFASSNGNQRSISGFINDNGGGANNYVSYFNTTRVVTFTTATTVGSAGASKHSEGLFAVTTDGFSVTFDSTAPNGWDLYYAAFSNVVQDISFAINSSASVQSNVAEVQRLTFALQSEFGVNTKLEPDFEIGTGVLKALSEVLVEASIEDDRIHGTVQNSSSPALARLIDITTTPQRIGVAGFGNSKFVAIHPPSTNTYPYRVAAARTSPGVQASSRGPFAFSMEENAGQDIYLSCTAGSIPGTRVLIL